MTDEAKKNDNAEELNEDDLEQVAGGLGGGFAGNVGEAFVGEAG